MAEPDHLVDPLRIAGEDRLDGAVVDVAHPAVQAARARLVHRPAAVPDALDAAVDAHVHAFHVSSSVSAVTPAPAGYSAAKATAIARFASRSQARRFIH